MRSRYEGVVAAECSWHSRSFSDAERAWTSMHKIFVNDLVAIS